MASESQVWCEDSRTLEPSLSEPTCTGSRTDGEVRGGTVEGFTSRALPCHTPGATAWGRGRGQPGATVASGLSTILLSDATHSALGIGEGQGFRMVKSKGSRPCRWILMCK